MRILVICHRHEKLSLRHIVLARLAALYTGSGRKQACQDCRPAVTELPEHLALIVILTRHFLPGSVL